MAEHNILGKEGEDIACKYLINKGYRIRHTNWRWKKLEIDIIAEKDNCIIIVEVKSRRNDNFGDPEDAVTYSKIRKLVSATDVYLKKYEIDYPVRFDIISITGTLPDIRIKHIEDAFLPPVW